MKLDYYVSHWEVKYIENDKDMYIKKFFTEEEAVIYARARRSEGCEVSITSIHYVEGWE